MQSGMDNAGIPAAYRTFDVSLKLQLDHAGRPREFREWMHSGNGLFFFHGVGADQLAAQCLMLGMTYRWTDIGDVFRFEPALLISVAQEYRRHGVLAISRIDQGVVDPSAINNLILLRMNDPRHKITILTSLDPHSLRRYPIASEAMMKGVSLAA
jgi:hypothetical protein